MLALVAAAFAVAACGGSGSASSAGGGGGSGSSDAQDTARVRLSTCLRKQGIDVPSNPGAGGGGGGGGQAGVNQAEIRKAMQGPCKKYQQRAFGNVNSQDQSEMRDRLTKFTSCMRKHGADVPDFDPSGGGGGGQAPSRIDQNDPAVKKATQACRSKLPQGGPGGPGQ